MDNRREFLRKASMLSGGVGLAGILPSSIQRALAIHPHAGSTWQDAEHVVFLMQENRSFDHCLGSLQGVRGFNDPRALTLPNGNPVWCQTNKAGDIYAPFRLNLHDTKITWMGGLPHAWADQVDARNGGRHDKWLNAKPYGAEGFQDMPMTLGYYTREDLPFYYALADAFTVCDQHFSSSLTGTTPNRLFFWTGTLRENVHSRARVWNKDTNYDQNAAWTTYPERLEAAGVSWRIYQNELSVGAGFTAEEDSWLANFTDNPLEWFTQYQVKLSHSYLAFLQEAPGKLEAEIRQLEKEERSGEEAGALQKQLNRKRQTLERLRREQKIYTRERYEQLTPREKNLHDKAFTTNREDPFYHQLTSVSYREGSVERHMRVPKGDVLHQFRQDVGRGKLPTVSWLVAPEKFSDHPSAPWYGAWYVSEVLDILTKDPEVWKKTIFILTYDENDGYFDHIPPFVVPDPMRPQSGKVSPGIDTEIEYVRKGENKAEDRESPVGLGYRVPMIVVSPWSRGGWVNSQLFDHTSSLQFLESFMAHRFQKNIKETNISNWRRCICGDLTSIFRPYRGEEVALPRPLERKSFLEKVHGTKFKAPPKGWKALHPDEIAGVPINVVGSALLPRQEGGVRNSSPLPYELYVDGHLHNKETFGIQFRAGKDVFGEKACGAPFLVYAGSASAGKVAHQQGATAGDNWSFAVAAGGQLEHAWSIEKNKGEMYHLLVYGPNGFFREFRGNAEDPSIRIVCRYEAVPIDAKDLTGNLLISLQNESKQQSYSIELVDHAYGQGQRSFLLKAATTENLVLDLATSFCWYDLSFRVQGRPAFLKRYAGRVETGRPGKSDPYMGGLYS
jgi:phospholipase C